MSKSKHKKNFKDSVLLTCKVLKGTNIYVDISKCIKDYEENDNELAIPEIESKLGVMPYCVEMHIYSTKEAYYFAFLAVEKAECIDELSNGVITLPFSQFETEIGKQYRTIIGEEYRTILRTSGAKLLN